MIDEDEARAWLAAVRETPAATAQRLHAKWRAAVGWIANGGHDAVRRMLVDDDGVDYAAYVRDTFLAESVGEIVDTWYEPGCCDDAPRGEACPVEVRVGRWWLWLDAGQYAARIRTLAQSVRPIFRAVADALGSPRFGPSPRRTRGVVARLLGSGGYMVRWTVRDVADLCLGGAIDVQGLVATSNPARAERACRLALLANRARCANCRAARQIVGQRSGADIAGRFVERGYGFERRRASDRKSPSSRCPGDGPKIEKRSRWTTVIEWESDARRPDRNSARRFFFANVKYRTPAPSWITPSCEQMG